MSVSGAVAEITNQTAFFARHETFHPRFGWLKKGFDAVNMTSDIFASSDAHITLGVGKNMAAAIRYWCSAFKVIDKQRGESKNSASYETTDFGSNLLADDGWDPWLENSASLWLLHWNLLKTPCFATAWQFVFNEFHKMEFAAEDIFSELAGYCDKLQLKVADSSLQKDLLCILRMYSEQPHKNFSGEESLDCPFVELGLIQKFGDSKYYQFRQGANLNLPSAVIVATALDYLAEIAPGQKTVSISSLLYSAGSPGLVLKLSENSLCAAIEEIGENSRSVSLTDSAGLVQMSCFGNPSEMSQTILDDYYG